MDANLCSYYQIHNKQDFVCNDKTKRDLTPKDVGTCNTTYIKPNQWTFYLLLSTTILLLKLLYIYFIIINYYYCIIIFIIINIVLITTVVVV
jgi:hypothetical protein